MVSQGIINGSLCQRIHKELDVSLGFHHRLRLAHSLHPISPKIIQLGYCGKLIFLILLHNFQCYFEYNVDN